MCRSVHSSPFHPTLQSALNYIDQDGNTERSDEKSVFRVPFPYGACTHTHSRRTV